MPGTARRDPTSLAIKVTLLMLMGMPMLAFAPLSPSLPEIHAEFAHVANIDYLARFVLTMPALFIAIAAPIAGIAVDRYGRKNLLLGSLVLYGIAGVAGYGVESIETLLVTRAIMGVAIGGIMSAGTALIGDYYTGSDRQKFIGLRGAVVNFAAVIFNSVGGLAASIDWRAAFLIYAVAFLVIPIVIRVIYEPDRSPKPGADTVAGQASEPDTTPYLFLAIAYLVTIIFSMAFFMVPVQLGFYLRELGNDLPLVAGLAIATSAFAVATSSLLFARLRARYQAETLMALAFIVSGIGFVLVSMATSMPFLFFALLVSGSGFGIMMANVVGWILDNTPGSIRGRVSGGIATATFVGQFLTPLVSQPIANVYSVGAAYAFVAGLQFIVAAAFVIYVMSNRRKARA